MWASPSVRRIIAAPAKPKPAGIKPGVRPSQQMDMAEIADLLAETCLVGVEADDGAGARVEYPLEMGRKLIRHISRAAPMAIVELFTTLQKNAGAEIGVSLEAVAGEANGA